jgi:hypothetical protein
MEVTLNTLHDGQLEKEFMAALPEMIEAIQETGKPASWSAKITLKPVKDMTQTFTMHSHSKTALPVLDRSSIIQEHRGKLFTETPMLSLEDEYHQLTIEEAIENVGRGMN